MPIQIPKTKRAPAAPTVPRAGHYEATVIRAAWAASKDEPHTLTWKFDDHEGHSWELTQELLLEEVGDVFVDLGLAGETVDLIKAVGRQALITVRTYGGRTSARVTDTQALL